MLASLIVYQRIRGEGDKGAYVVRNNLQYSHSHTHTLGTFTDTQLARTARRTVVVITYGVHALAIRAACACNPLFELLRTRVYGYASRAHTLTYFVFAFIRSSTYT